MNIRLDGQVALVTGAARGIGRACALALAEAGADIALGLLKQSRDEGLADEIRALGRRVLPLQLDVSQPAQARAAVDEAGSHFGRIDILVNNAGVGPPNPIEKVTEADFDYTLGINLKGTFFTSQAVGPWMIRQKHGRIINLSSQAGFIALPTESVYCMTKAAIAHLTKCFAVEWGPHQVTVNAVAPTFIRTPGTEKWLLNEEFKQQVLSNIVLGRVGVPQDVASTVVFLASPAAALITGTTVMIDGGWTAR